MKTHGELIDISYKWLMKKCAFAFKELVTVNKEQPDIIGFNSSGSFVLEIKVSRSDFLADKKKPFRLNAAKGMGDWRFFVAPKGLIKIEELPLMWGLIEIDEKGKCLEVFNPFGKGNIYSLWLRNVKNIEAEMNVMYSALRRLNIK